MHDWPYATPDTPLGPASNARHRPRRSAVLRWLVLCAAVLVSSCRQAGVPKLVYTSSPSVTFDGRDQNGVDESTPYPPKFLAHYPQWREKPHRNRGCYFRSGRLH